MRLEPIRPACPSVRARAKSRRETQPPADSAAMSLMPPAASRGAPSQSRHTCRRQLPGGSLQPTASDWNPPGEQTRTDGQDHAGGLQLRIRGVHQSAAKMNMPRAPRGLQRPDTPRESSAISCVTLPNNQGKLCDRTPGDAWQRHDEGASAARLAPGIDDAVV